MKNKDEVQEEQMKRKN